MIPETFNCCEDALVQGLKAFNSSFEPLYMHSDP